MEKKYVVGVDLGGTKIYTALVDLEGNIIKEKTVETLAQEGEKAVLGRLIETISYVIDGTDKSLIKSIGIGSPGPLDVKNGIIIESANLPFKNFEIVKNIRETYDLPTYLDNDANVATLGEFMFGAGKGTENMVFITASTGIGGGAVLNGKLFRGATGNALEIGHMTVSTEGPRCGCGNLGCAEALGSGTAIGKRAKEAVLSNVTTSLKNYDNVTSKEVFKEAANGDRVAKNILKTSLTYLGIAVANTITNFDPEKVVIGGGVVNGGDIVIDTIRNVVEERCMAAFVENCAIEKAVLGGKAGVLGAAALAITER
ncbi:MULTISPECIES: ROK family protein [unclassified Clostridium]|uniref:ROK family protein n=1 Tax=unclassified Clostridium TaxID=2614128 RepID=UPI001898EC93|nr:MULTISPECIES: ROK family protein [unclassified Clostridium]MBP3917266.1 ROK family protein [Clostridium sp.]MEE0933708.1 ROK family protein [Clostridium sp.]